MKNIIVTPSTKPEELIGAYYELLNIDNSIMDRIVIKEAEWHFTKEKIHADGSVSPTTKHMMVSENGTGWYRVYGSGNDRIFKK